jgi:hypothetical protein
MDEQHHRRSLTPLIVIPAIYALVKGFSITHGGTKAVSRMKTTT